MILHCSYSWEDFFAMFGLYFDSRMTIFQFLSDNLTKLQEGLPTAERVGKTAITSWVLLTERCSKVLQKTDLNPNMFVHRINSIFYEQYVAKTKPLVR